MYYKFYRRRRTIYILTIATATLFYLFFSKNNFETNSNSFFSYIPPDPCKDCPGENGRAVFLSVCIAFFCKFI